MDVTRLYDEALALLQLVGQLLNDHHGPAAACTALPSATHPIRHVQAIRAKIHSGSLA
jgi:hypothetical protein